MYGTQDTKLGQRPPLNLTVEASALTLQGERRANNQDVVFERSAQVEADLHTGLYMVCDGVGGRRAGEVASRLTVGTIIGELTGVFPNDSLLQQQTHLSPPRLDEWLRFAITLANTHLRRYAETHWEQAGGMGSTIALALIYGSTAHIANVGDSRVYVARAGQVTQITRDHSMAAKLAEAGLINENEIALHPRRNVLYQALGSQQTVEVALFQWKLEPNDRLLLCSDGLWAAFPDKAELARWLSSPTPPDNLCRQLVSEAIRRDGSDDTSAIVVKVA